MNIPPQLTDLELRELRKSNSFRDAEHYESGITLADNYMLSRLKTIISLIREMVPMKASTLLADIGCGDGYLLADLRCEGLFTPDQMVACDFAFNRVVHSAQKTPLAVTGNARSAPFHTNFFDVTICADMLEHSPFPELIVEELIRITKRGGLIIVSFPNELLWRLGRAFLLRFPLRIEGHIQILSPRRVIHFFRNCVLERQIFLPWNLPWKLSLTAVMAFNKL